MYPNQTKTNRTEPNRTDENFRSEPNKNEEAKPNQAKPIKFKTKHQTYQLQSQEQSPVEVSQSFDMSKKLIKEEHWYMKQSYFN